jgi:hypothetical protein
VRVWDCLNSEKEGKEETKRKEIKKEKYAIYNDLGY